MRRVKRIDPDQVDLARLHHHLETLGPLGRRAFGALEHVVEERLGAVTLGLERAFEEEVRRGIEDVGEPTADKLRTPRVRVGFGGQLGVALAAAEVAQSGLELFEEPMSIDGVLGVVGVIAGRRCRVEIVALFARSGRIAQRTHAYSAVVGVGLVLVLQLRDKVADPARRIEVLGVTGLRVEVQEGQSRIGVGPDVGQELVLGAAEHTVGQPADLIHEHRLSGLVLERLAVLAFLDGPAAALYGGVVQQIVHGLARFPDASGAQQRDGSARLIVHDDGALAVFILRVAGDQTRLRVPDTVQRRNGADKSRCIRSRKLARLSRLD
ncbi:MAG: hypothetical protein MOGMAGMI_02049 [Candidatus Omnitrophica bacterium]|nr:hypothetical protein [Candidatus Omnitrophota bacterium]